MTMYLYVTTRHCNIMLQYIVTIKPNNRVCSCVFTPAMSCIIESNIILLFEYITNHYYVTHVLKTFAEQTTTQWADNYKWTRIRLIENKILTYKNAIESIGCVQVMLRITNWGRSLFCDQLGYKTQMALKDEMHTLIKMFSMWYQRNCNHSIIIIIMYIRVIWV